MLRQGGRDEPHRGQHLSLGPAVDAANLRQISVDRARAVAVLKHGYTCTGQFFGSNTPGTAIAQQVEPLAHLHIGPVVVGRQISSRKLTKGEVVIILCIW